MIALIAFALGLTIQASQPPIPTPPKISETPQQESTSHGSEPKTEIQVSGQPVTITVNPPLSQQQTSTPNQASRNQNDSASSNGPNWLIAIFTLVIAGATIVQVIIYGRMLQTGKIVERGWVSIETLDIEIRPPDDQRVIIARFRNSGKTPVHIVDANITARCGLADLPDVPEGAFPEYDVDKFRPPTTLVANEMSGMWYPIENTIGNAHRFAIAHFLPGKTTNVWLYGYVHYTDSFDPKVVRRYGWARKYDPIMTKLKGNSAFMFTHENKRGYNYAD
jgi:hypothetical protein